MRGPDLELGVAGRSQADDELALAVGHLHAADHLGMAAVEALGQPDERRAQSDGPAHRRRQVAEAVVALLGRATPVVAGNQREHVHLVRREPAEAAVLDQVVRMPVMAGVADVEPRVVQQGTELDPLALAVAQAVQRARLVEE